MEADMDTRTLDGVGLTPLQEFWIKHVKQCEDVSSGMVKEYALKNGLEPQDLYRWRSWFRKRGMLRASDQEVSIFQSLTVVRQEDGGSGRSQHGPLKGVVIQLPNRVRFEFSEAVDLATLGTLFHQAAGLP